MLSFSPWGSYCFFAFVFLCLSVARAASFCCRLRMFYKAFCAHSSHRRDSGGFRSQGQDLVHVQGSERCCMHALRSIDIFFVCVRTYVLCPSFAFHQFGRSIFQSVICLDICCRSVIAWLFVALAWRVVTMFVSSRWSYSSGRCIMGIVRVLRIKSAFSLAAAVT